MIQRISKKLQRKDTVIDMGTRNITSVILDDEQKVCQYCQWDGYPTGAGASILEFLKDCNFEQFKKALENTKINVVDYNHAYSYTGSPKNIGDISEMVFKMRSKLRDENPDGDYPSNEEALKRMLEKGMITEQQAEEFYVSTRDTGCDVLPYIYNRSLDKPPLEIYAMAEEFNGEYSWDIQGIYILNLDEMTLDMTYNGFNKIFDITNIPLDIDREMIVLEECINNLSNALDYGNCNNLQLKAEYMTDELIKNIKENKYIEDVTDEDLVYMREFAEKYFKETLELRLNKEVQKSIDNTIAGAEERSAENKTEESVNRSEIEME